ncbi:universal stress protein [Gramella lutea]|uniref:Universal stress protein n=1 Tax=Christiangramia lutea TaxID=1607951 RepID=A0A9X1V730_9FLAO|nr:universal stress protein [Christiangramia lutea]MCH4824234.1 universal stress protein [Christiangramia lutea]
MEKKILVPTNFSKHSWNALIFAMNLYKKHACTFYLINVYHSQNFLSDAIALGKEKEQKENEEQVSKKGLERMMKGLDFRKENQKHQFKTISYKGGLKDGIQETVEKYGVELIVLGAAGEIAGINSINDSSISKISEEIEECPIMVVPEKYELKTNKLLELVFPSNFRIPFKKKELTPLIELSLQLGASIRVLYINSEGKKLTEEQEKIKAELSGHLEEIDFSFHTLTQTSPSTGVHLFIESRESDLLALYQRKQGFFSKLFRSNRSNEINFDPKLPVLVLKEVQ